MARLNVLQTASLSKLADSATSFEDVSTILGSSDYEPEHPFKGIYVTGAGVVNIQGVDGVNMTFDLDKGIFPLGGQKILQASTTATGIRALR